MKSSYVNNSLSRKRLLKPSRTLIQSSKIGLISLFLPLLLTSCATTAPLTVKETKVVPVPHALTLETPDPLQPLPSALTNGQMFTFLKQYQAALQSCNNDKMLIESFLQAQEGDGQPVSPNR